MYPPRTTVLLCTRCIRRQPLFKSSTPVNVLDVAPYVAQQVSTVARLLHVRLQAVSAPH